MRVLRFLAVLALAAGLHLVAVRLFPDFPLYVDLFLVVAVFHARDGHSVAGMLGGAAAGLLADGLSGGPYGLQGFADTLIGYATARGAQQLVLQRPAGLALLFAVAAAAQQLLLAGLALALLPEPELPRLASLVAKAASTGLLGWGLHTLERTASGALEGRRQRRAATLR